MSNELKAFFSALHRYDVGASSDLTGVRGHPGISLDFWSTCFPPGTIIAQELLAWDWLRKDTQYPFASDHLVGVHGIPGDDRKIHQNLLNVGELLDIFKLKALNTLFTNTELLLCIASELGKKRNTPIYVLNHEPVAKKLIPFLNAHHFKNIVYAIEVHPSPGSLQKCLTLKQQLDDLGIPNVIVFDIVHHMKGLPQEWSYEKQWNQMIDDLCKIGQCLVHLPIGLFQFDSVQIHEVTGDMWQRFGKAVHEHNSFQILEHQLGGIGPSIWFNWFTPMQQRMFIDRTRKVVDALFEHGVFQARESQ